MSHGEAGPCSVSNGHCQLYGNGHHLHWFPAGHIGQAPWGWRDAIVESGDEDGWAVIHYVAEDARVRVWHHRHLLTGLAPGSPVRLHERYNTLDCQYGWLNVAFTGGLGPVPTPEHPELWTQETTTVIVNNATGRGIPADRPDVDDKTTGPDDA